MVMSTLIGDISSYKYSHPNYNPNSKSHHPFSTYASRDRLIGSLSGLGLGGIGYIRQFYTY